MAIDIQGLLENPNFNLGVGLLGASGYSPVPKSIGQVIQEGAQYANSRQQATLQNQYMRDRLADEKRQRQARTELGGLFKPGQTPGPVVAPTQPGIMQPGGLLQAAGLASEGGLGNMASGLLSAATASPAGPKTSAAFNDYVALGGNPNDLQGYAAYQQSLDPSAQLQAQLAQLNINNAQREQEADATKQAVTLSTQSQTLDRTISNIQKMYDLASRLEGTPLELGTPAANAVKTGLSVKRALSEITGIGNPEEYREAVADFNEFSKLSAGLTIDTFSGLEGIPRANAAMELLRNSQPGAGLDTIANKRVLSALLDETIGTAEIFGEGYSKYRPKNIEKGRTFLKGLTPINFDELP